MELIRYLYHANGFPAFDGPQSCWLTGWPCPDDSPFTSKAIRDTFTNHDLARCPASPVVCPAAAWYFDHCGARSGQLIMKHWYGVHTPETDVYHAQEWPRETMRSALLQALDCPPSHDAIYCIALSKQKHLALRAPVTPAHSRLAYVQLEEQTVTLTPDGFAALLFAFDALLSLGFTKSAILSDTYPTHLLSRLPDAHAISRWRQARAHIKPYLNTPPLSLVSYVTLLPKEEPDAPDA